MKKILSMVVVMLLGVASMQAQNPDKGLSFALETGIGSEWELGARAQYNFNKYVAWDVVNLKYALDYNNHGNWNEFTIQTGVRGFSPTFGPDMKAFAALDLGYGNMWKNGNTSCFALDFTLGLYLYKGLYAGYGFGTLINDGSHHDHLLRIGYNFTF